MGCCFGSTSSNAPPPPKKGGRRTLAPPPQEKGFSDTTALASPPGGGQTRGGLRAMLVRSNSSRRRLQERVAGGDGSDLDLDPATEGGSSEAIAGRESDRLRAPSLAYEEDEGLEMIPGPEPRQIDDKNIGAALDELDAAMSSLLDIHAGESDPEEDPPIELLRPTRGPQPAKPAGSDDDPDSDPPPGAPNVNGSLPVPPASKSTPPAPPDGRTELDKQMTPNRARTRMLQSAKAHSVSSTPRNGVRRSSRDISILDGAVTRPSPDRLLIGLSKISAHFLDVKNPEGDPDQDGAYALQLARMQEPFCEQLDCSIEELLALERDGGVTGEATRGMARSPERDLLIRTRAAAAAAPPPTEENVLAYLKRMHKMCQWTPETLTIGCLLMARTMHGVTSPDGQKVWLRLTYATWRRAWLAVMLVAQKTQDDCPLRNSEFAEVWRQCAESQCSGIYGNSRVRPLTAKDIGKLEKTVLLFTGWSVMAGRKCYASTYFELVALAPTHQPSPMRAWGHGAYKRRSSHSIQESDATDDGRDPSLRFARSEGSARGVDAEPERMSILQSKFFESSAEVVDAANKYGVTATPMHTGPDSMAVPDEVTDRVLLRERGVKRGASVTVMMAPTA